MRLFDSPGAEGFTMPVQMLCPECGKSFSIAEEAGARTRKCRYCLASLVTQAPSDSSSETNRAPGISPNSAKASIALEPPALPAMIGPYKIRKSLGSGAFGQVLLAFDPKLDRELALKVPHPGILNNARATERFLREARAGARLHHPNIVTVFEVGQDGP